MSEPGKPGGGGGSPTNRTIAGLQKALAEDAKRRDAAAGGTSPKPDAKADAPKAEPPKPASVPVTPAVAPAPPPVVAPATPVAASTPPAVVPSPASAPSLAKPSDRPAAATPPPSATAPPANAPPPAAPPAERSFLVSLVRFVLWGGVALGVVAIGAVIGLNLFLRIVAGLTLTDQKLAATLPPEFDISARVTNVLEIVMNGTIRARVPFKQHLALPVRGTYRTEIDVDTRVPVKFEVVYDGTIPVDTIADIEARANFNFQDVKSFRALDVKARLPMKMNLPVRLVAPVDTMLHLRWKGPVSLAVDQVLTADVDTVLNTSLAVNQRVSAPVTADIPLHVYSPRAPIKVVIDHADLRLNMDTLRLERSANPDGPQRAPTEWGPAE